MSMRGTRPNVAEKRALRAAVDLHGVTELARVAGLSRGTTATAVAGAAVYKLCLVALLRAAQQLAGDDATTNPSAQRVA